MAGKGLALATRRIGYALDALSKNALIDLVVDRARAEIGEDTTDEDLANRIQDWIDPVTRARGDRPITLRVLISRLDKNDEDYRNKTGKHAPAKPCPTCGRVGMGACSIGQCPGPDPSPEKMREAFEEQRKEPYRWT